MKKFLLSVSVLTLLLCGFIGCTPTQQWNREQRQSLRNMLRDYRRMVYLNDLNEAEYMLFSDDVTSAIEQDYPVYTTFIEMPGVGDTVQVYVVTTIVEQLATDAHNMRHLFPDPYLVANGILPDGLDHNQLRQFYACLAAKVNQQYLTVEQFFNALLSESADYQQIVAMQSACANDLFGWTMVIEEVVTPAPQP